MDKAELQKLAGITETSYMSDNEEDAYDDAISRLAELFVHSYAQDERASREYLENVLGDLKEAINFRLTS